ncbi:MAG TPA: PSD1 and planctomycete cytochrome C domain-containing protein [Gemmataceae bacterium]|nr:PSD1 and planctomycete cytochrome C domain-containing protein [Gemmataceae bacterium]
MKKLSRWLVLGGLLAGWLAVPLDLGAQSRPGSEQKPAARETPSPEQLAFFEKNIRPVLVRECYSCHSKTAEKVRGGLLLDTRDGIRKSGENGPAVVPGDARKSRLLMAIKQKHDELKMPPKKKLADDVIADFEKWIVMGAPDPRDTPARVTKNEIDIEKGRKFWSFQPPKKTAPPAVKDAAWARSDIDRFLLADLEAKGLKPVADADPRTLIRRLTLDLTGLPPSPEDVEAFVKEHGAKPQAALARAVDRLLASPAFGERWGRHWLDVARYAESSGRSINFAYPHAWRYRDYVIAAFNADKPYDRFIREQIAGDLLSPKDDKEKAEFLVATGFLAIGPKTHDEFNRQQFQMDVIDEQIDATFQAFQGLTVACARCHDHKFDPIPQKDYYAVAGIFRSTEACYGTVRVFLNNHPSPMVTLPKDAGVTIPLEPLTAERRAGIERQIQDVRDQMSNVTGQNAFIRRILLQSRVTTLRSQLALYESDGTPIPLAMGVRESRRATDSRVYIRGELRQPGDTVKRGFPQVMTTKQPSINRGSGRRELADWIASKDNPLTARVMANRVWLHLIGRGLVVTPDNFGNSGQRPSHAALLDHLALSFAENGWSVKKLIRSVVLSRAYQLSSQFDEKNFEADPDNVLVWRMPKRRLEAEALRDSMLALAGRLDATPPKGSTVSRGGEGNVSFRARGGGPGGDPASTATYRTVYLSIVRDGLPEMLTLFDFPDPSLIIGERATTTVPAQSLYLMNNPFVIRQAGALADRLLAGSEDDAGKLIRAYMLCYSRPPSKKELETAQQFLARYGEKQSRRSTWTALCQAFFASAEFSHR